MSFQKPRNQSQVQTIIKTLSGPTGSQIVTRKLTGGGLVKGARGHHSKSHWNSTFVTVKS